MTVPSAAIELIRGYRELMARETASRSAQAPEWLTAWRGASAERLVCQGLPTKRDESWRYTSLDFLSQHDFAPVADVRLVDIAPDELASCLLADTETARLVFVNGRYQASLSTPERAGQGVTVGSFDEWLERDPERTRTWLGMAAEDRPEDFFGNLNAGFMVDGAILHLARDVSAECPLELLHITKDFGNPIMMHPRHLVILEDGARAQLIERYLGLDDSLYFNNAAVELSLGQGAELVHERLQEEGPGGHHLVSLRIRQGAESHYRQVSAALGGAWARTGIRVDFAGEGARADLDGLYLAGDRQLNDVHLDVRHAVPGCSSRERFKGILDGRGRAVFDGRVLVARDAQKTDARLSNDNLMLSRNAEVDTKPQLEIYADDVSCSHGTTVGQLDDGMLFYLRSRGIAPDKARQMLCLGFAGEVLESFASEELQNRAADLLRGRLAAVVQETGTEEV